ncbi:hypothetical protein MMC21_000869 [Puttea exsequens]|nr:hypothetical protein [Puttea exsequens]
MPTRSAVSTNKAPAPLPVYSQAIICNGMVYCSGQIATNPETGVMVDGGIADRACLKNLQAVLEEAGSGLGNVVRVGVFLTDMTNFGALNTIYDGFFSTSPKPARTCVAVKELPMRTDVEIECVAHL